MDFMMSQAVPHVEAPVSWTSTSTKLSEGATAQQSTLMYQGGVVDLFQPLHGTSFFMIENVKLSTALDITDSSYLLPPFVHATSTGAPYMPSPSIPPEDLLRPPPTASFCRVTEVPLLQERSSERPRKRARRPPLEAVEALEVHGQQYMEHIRASGELMTTDSNNEWEDVDERADNASKKDNMGAEPSNVVSNGPRLTPVALDPHADPFQYVPAVWALRTPADVHPNPAVFLIYTLVVWLHTQWHLPFAACNTLLVVLRFILDLAGAHIDPPIRITLGSAMNALDVDPAPRILPVCINCQRVYPANTAHDTACLPCDKPLFNIKPSKPDQERRKAVGTNPTPVLPVAIKSIQEQLEEMLLVPGFEKSLQLWKDVTRTPGIYHDIHDGAVCKEILGPDGKPFYCKQPHNNELRIGLSLSLDW
jgi:hypothetical protein